MLSTKLAGRVVIAAAWCLCPLPLANGELIIDLSLDPASIPAEFDIDAGSFGDDPIHLLLAGRISDIFFSVDRVAIGLPDSVIRQQSQPPIESAHGDIYRFTFPGGPHAIFRREVSLGLDPGFLGDDLDALQFTPGGPAVNINTVFPYQSLWRHSLLLDDLGVNPSDILFGNEIFADGVFHIGLDADDDLDALILMDVTPNGKGGFTREPNGVLDPGLDMAIFSLDPFSPSTFTGDDGLWSPADLLITSFLGDHSLLVLAEDFQLDMGDNVDALTIIPAPGAGLLLVVALALRRHRRRRNGI